MRPYDLRHAFCSLLIAEGLSVVEVARQAGHAPTMTLDTYAHVMADVDGSDRVSAEASIRAAREAEVSESVRLVARTRRRAPKPPRSRQARLRTRTENLFITSEVLCQLS
jgi:hypothetical protein